MLPALEETHWWVGTGSAAISSHPQVEKLARTLFLWKIDVHDQKERVYEMRRWNEALVTNMLPEHVARHFLGSKKRDEVRGAQEGGFALLFFFGGVGSGSKGFAEGSG